MKWEPWVGLFTYFNRIMFSVSLASTNQSKNGIIQMDWTAQQTNSPSRQTVKTDIQDKQTVKTDCQKGSQNRHTGQTDSQNSQNRHKSRQLKQTDMVDKQTIEADRHGRQADN